MRLYTLFLILLFSCSEPVNTWDPQVSPNPKLSKEYGYFVAEYEANIDNRYIIDKAWIEKCWKYTSNNGKAEKIETNDCRHLVFQFEKGGNLPELESYFKKWEMILLPQNIPVSRKNDEFYVYYPSLAIPEKLAIKLVLLENHKMQTDSAILWLSRKSTQN